MKSDDGRTQTPSSRRLFRLWSPLTAFVVISFVAGFIIGLKIYSDRSREAFLEKQKSAVRILAPKNLFSKPVKLSLAERTGWLLDFVEVDTPLDLWQRLESPQTSGAFDLVFLYSYQIPLAFQLGKIQPLDRARLPKNSAIHPDFINLPGDPALENVAPVLWGLTGIATHSSMKTPFTSWKSVLEAKGLDNQIGLPWSATELLRIALVSRSSTEMAVLPQPGAALTKLLNPWLDAAVFASRGERVVSLLDAKPLKVLAVSQAEMAFTPLKGDSWSFRLPDGGATLWILSAAVGREVASEDGAYAVLNALEGTESAKGMNQSTHQASVNRLLEKETQLDPRLKASYLRKVPIGSYVLWTDFSRAREIDDLMSKASRRP